MYPVAGLTRALREADFVVLLVPAHGRDARHHRRRGARRHEIERVAHQHRPRRRRRREGAPRGPRAEADRRGRPRRLRPRAAPAEPPALANGQCRGDARTSRVRARPTPSRPSSTTTSRAIWPDARSGTSSTAGKGTESCRPAVARSACPRRSWRGFLDEERVLTLATVGPGGRPHLMPLWYVREGSTLVAWTYGKSQKIRNLERDRARHRAGRGRPRRLRRAARGDARVRRGHRARSRARGGRSAYA